MSRQHRCGNESVQCSDIEPSQGTKCYVIDAKMGAGKTYVSKRYVANRIEEEKLLRVLSNRIRVDEHILIVTTRRSFAFTQMENYRELGFVHYKYGTHTVESWKQLQRDVKEKKAEPEGDYLASKRLVIQYESLHHLFERGGNHKWDLVVLDEARSIAANMCCRITNTKEKLARNSQMLKIIMQQSSMTLATDAHTEYDSCVPSFLQSVFQPEQIEVHRYSYLKLRRTIHALKLW